MTNLENSIINFYKENNGDNSIIIDGPWGIGKTYTIMQTLKNVETLNNKIKYISLMGYKNITNIVKDIVMDEHNVLNKVEFNELIKSLGFGAFKSGMSNEFLEVEDDENEPTKASLFKNNVFIFDDIETYKGDANELIRMISGITRAFENNQEGNYFTNKNINKIDRKNNIPNQMPKFFLIANSESLEKEKKEEDLRRLSDKLEADIITVNNRQGSDTLNKELVNLIIKTESLRNNGIQLFTNMRVLKSISTKWNSLEKLDDKNESTFYNIVDKEKIFVKCYYDMESNINIIKKIETLYLNKLMRKTTTEHAIKFNLTEKWTHTIFWDSYSNIFLRYFKGFIKLNTLMEKLDVDIKYGKGDYIDNIILSMRKSKGVKFNKRIFFMSIAKRFREKASKEDTKTLAYYNPLQILTILLEISFVKNLDLEEMTEDIKAYMLGVIHFINGRKKDNINTIGIVDSWNFPSEANKSIATTGIITRQLKQNYSKWFNKNSKIISKIKDEVGEEVIRKIITSDLLNEILKIFLRHDWTKVETDPEYLFLRIKLLEQKEVLSKQIFRYLMNWVHKNKSAGWSLGNILDFMEVLLSIYTDDDNLIKTRIASIIEDQLEKPNIRKIDAIILKKYLEFYKRKRN